MATIPSNRQIHAQLLIGRPDGVTWTDVSEYLASAEVELGDVSSVGTGASGVDGVVRQLSFTLRNHGAVHPAWDESIAQDELYVVGEETDTVGDEKDSGALLINMAFGVDNEWTRESFSPRDRTSSWNQFGGQYSPLLWPNREVQLRVAVTTPGITPVSDDWVTLFHGYLGDNISTSGHTIDCSCRDLAKRLMDCYIEEPKEYGSEAGTAAETVIQAIIDDNLGAGEVSLYTPVSPGFMITPYIVEYQSVWDAIQQIASQIGWFLGYRWDAGTSQYRLSFMEPPRTKDASTADFTLDWMDDFYTEDLDINDADIRNAVKVSFRDSATGERAYVAAEDATSIAEYGRRAMQIEEADTSLIDTVAEAQDMADAALADLKDLTATTRINMPLYPEMDILSGIVVKDPRVSSTDDFYGVESVRHALDFENNRFRTEVIGAGRVIGAHTKWLRMQTRPGATAPTPPEAVGGGGRIMPQPAGVTATGIIRGIAVAFDEPGINKSRWAHSEVHISTTSGFTPSSATLKDVGRKTHFEITDGLTSGTTYYVKVYHVSLTGSKSVVSSEVSAVAGTVDYDDINVAFAQASGGIWTVLHVAQSDTDWNEIKLTDFFVGWNVGDKKYTYLSHSNLENELQGLPGFEAGLVYGTWDSWGMQWYNEIATKAMYADGSQRATVAWGVVNLSPNSMFLGFNLLYKGTGLGTTYKDLYLRFRRHAVR